MTHPAVLTYPSCEVKFQQWATSDPQSQTSPIVELWATSGLASRDRYEYVKSWPPAINPRFIALIPVEADLQSTAFKASLTALMQNQTRASPAQ
jgi:hypothetical protein